MKQLIRQTDEMLKLNLRQLVVFLGMYRLVAGTFYIGLVNQLLRFSLRAAGYSYLTAGNMRAFLWRPLTLICIFAAAVPGMVLMVVETGGLMAAYEASARRRTVDSLMILREAVSQTIKQLRMKNWQLLLLALADYIMMNIWILFRVLTKVRPVNFVIYEIAQNEVMRVIVPVLAAALAIFTIPAMLVFFACMSEGKTFREGVRRSRELMKGRWPAALKLLLFVNAVLLGIMVLLYIVIVAISAILVTIFVQKYVALAALTAVCGRLELAMLFIGAFLTVMADFGALTVIYHQFDARSRRGGSWDFSLSIHGHVKRKWFLAATGALAGAGLFMIADMVCNGPSDEWSLLGQTEITAHRGSCQVAPENTVASLEAAIEEMADFCEIDVRTTSDGAVILCHDPNVKRVAGVDRRIEDMTSEEVGSLDAGYYFPGTEKENFATLEQALEVCKGRIRLNIELKNVGDQTELPEYTAALVKEFGMEDQCVITSSKLGYLERVKDFAPDLKTGYILPAAYGKYYENEVIDFISIRSGFVDRQLVEAAHEKGKGVHVWTVNSKTELERMKMVGADNIITDYPARAREILYREEATETLLEYLQMLLR